MKRSEKDNGKREGCEKKQWEMKRKRRNNGRRKENKFEVKGTMGNEKRV